MRGGETQQLSLRAPGPVLKITLIGLFAIWLVFALAVNWGGASGQSFLLLVSNSAAISEGQLWRLGTAMLVHAFEGDIGHILSVLIGLYFLGSSLEEAWGGKRFARFLALSGVLAYSTQFLFSLILPAELGAKLIPQIQFGAMPVVEAVAIAWACSFSGRTVLLFFVLPVSSRGLILLVVGVSLMTLIAGGMPPSGHIALFAGMGYGWLLGGGNPSPFRRFYLRYRLAGLEREAQAEHGRRKKRAEGSGFRVIKGGRDRSPPSDRGGSGGTGGMLH